MSAIRSSLTNRFIASTLTATSLLLGASDARAGGAPDISVNKVEGPTTGAAGENTIVTTKCSNPGGYYNGVLYVDIYLSLDSTITEADLLVDSDDFNNFATQMNPKSIFKLPANLPTGTYYWGSIVHIPGGSEVNLANNVKAGGLVEIDGIDPPTSDICLDDTSSIDVSFSVGQQFPSPITRAVQNCGESGSTLNWSLTGTAPAWISASTSSGSVEPGTPQTTSIQLNPNGLTPNLYTTTLRFENDEDPTDYELVSVAFVVGTVDFIPGDKLSGVTTAGQPSHTRTFLGGQGMKLKLSTKKLGKKLKLFVTVKDAQGNTIGAVSMKKSGKKKKATMTLPKDGIYTMIIETLGGTGNYTLKTKGKGGS